MIPDTINYSILIFFYSKNAKALLFGAKIAVFPTLQQNGHPYSKISSAITCFMLEKAWHLIRKKQY
jgi:hypothetical protein